MYIPSSGQLQTKPQARWYLRLVVSLLVLATLVTILYTALSIYIATQLIYAPQLPVRTTQRL